MDHFYVFFFKLSGWAINKIAIKYVVNGDKRWTYLLNMD